MKSYLIARWSIAGILIGGFLLATLAWSFWPGDPSKVRLATGSDAVLFDDQNGAIMLEPENRRSILMATGTPVSVVADDEPTTDDNHWRDVRIAVTGGPDSGVVGRVKRFQLRAR